MESYSEDLTYGFITGKVLMAKHFLVGLDLHNFIRKKPPIQIINRFVHCMDYNMACEIETTHADANR